MDNSEGTSPQIKTSANENVNKQQQQCENGLFLTELLKKIDTIDPFASSWQPENRVAAKIWLMNNYKEDEAVTEQNLKQKEQKQSMSAGTLQIINRIKEILQQLKLAQDDSDSSFDMNRKSSGSLSSSHGDVDRDQEQDQSIRDNKRTESQRKVQQ